MDQRADYLIQILEKLGSPLMGAIVDVAQSGEPNQDAQNMASLIGKSVELSISLANVADLNNAQDDSVRLALAALSSSLISSLHRKNKQVPGDNDLKRITSALQAVLTFSENFTPEETNTDRLKYLEHQGTAADGLQMSLQYMHAFVPAMNAIGAFPFGMPEQKLIMDVSSRITAQATALRKHIVGNIEEEKGKLVDLAILKTFVEIYAACHRNETERLSNSEDKETMDMAASLKNVWSAFDLRVGMVEALAESLLPGGVAGERTSSATDPAPAEPIKQAEPSAPPTNSPSSPAPEEKTSSEQSATQANPMSMFAKPKTEEAKTQNPEASDSAESPPSSEQKSESPASPPAQANPMAMFAKPKQSSSSDQDSQDEKEAEDSSDDGKAEGGDNNSPMSFFKKSD